MGSRPVYGFQFGCLVFKHSGGYASGCYVRIAAKYHNKSDGHRYIQNNIYNDVTILAPCACAIALRRITSRNQRVGPNLQPGVARLAIDLGRILHIRVSP